jgi:enterobactin synthetase component D / holo-[acyl-carrier protein] synthase
MHSFLISMQIEAAPALSKRFPLELQPERLVDAEARQIEQTEVSKLRSTVERVVIRAMADAESSLGLGENVGLAVVSERDLADQALHPGAVQVLAPRACRRKQVEFALGRTAAHFALKQIGVENLGPVLRGPGGEPLWSDGIVGSISHCYPWGVAVVISGSNRFVIGLDLETTEGIQETDISHLVCHAAELDWVRQGPSQERLAMIFSAKEAIYKAFYPLCRRYIDFKEVKLTWYPEQDNFQGEFLAPLSPNFSQRETCIVHCSCHATLFFSCVIHQLPIETAYVQGWELDSLVPQNPITGCLATSEGGLGYE